MTMRMGWGGRGSRNQTQSQKQGFFKKGQRSGGWGVDTYWLPKLPFKPRAWSPPFSVCLKSLLFIDWIKVTRRVGPSRVGFESGAFVKRSQPERNTAWFLKAAGLVL